MASESRSCTLAGHFSVRLGKAEIAVRRRVPGPYPGKFPISLLKNADEQTVAALSAVLHAIHDHSLAPAGLELFQDWGVVGAAHFIGRDILSRDVPDFQKEGPWGVSPHVIPHRSLHSPAGAISVGLKIHGPNYGAGGGHGFEAEGLPSALSLLWGKRLPGVWLVLTRIDPVDVACDGSGHMLEGAFAEAVALALVPSGAGPRLEMLAGEEGQHLTFDALRNLARGGTWALPGLGRVRVVPPAVSPVPTLPLDPVPVTPRGGMG